MATDCDHVIPIANVIRRKLQDLTQPVHAAPQANRNIVLESAYDLLAQCAFRANERGERAFLSAIGVIAPVG